MDQTLQKQRDKIHRAIWKIANDLRGSIDGWDFKNYVLGTMFYRYISENITSYVNKNERINDPDFNYADISDATAEQARETLSMTVDYLLPLASYSKTWLRNAIVTPSGLRHI